MAIEIYCREHDIFDCWFHGDQGVKMDIYGFLGEIARIVTESTKFHFETKGVSWMDGDLVDIRVWAREMVPSGQLVLIDPIPYISVKLTDRDTGEWLDYRYTPLV